jgi:hypothetical protein
MFFGAIDTTKINLSTSPQFWFIQNSASASATVPAMRFDITASQTGDALDIIGDAGAATTLLSLSTLGGPGMGMTGSLNGFFGLTLTQLASGASSTEGLDMYGGSSSHLAYLKYNNSSAWLTLANVTNSGIYFYTNNASHATLDASGNFSVSGYLKTNQIVEAPGELDLQSGGSSNVIIQSPGGSYNLLAALSASQSIGIGTLSVGTSAVKVLAMGLATAPTTAPSGVTQVYSSPLGGGGSATLGVRTEYAPYAYTSGSPTTCLPIDWNGTHYCIFGSTAL